MSPKSMLSDSNGSWEWFRWRLKALVVTLTPAGSILLIVSLQLISAEAYPDDNVEHDPVLAKLFDTLATADNQRAAQETEGKIWQSWFGQSPSADVRAALDAGMKRREAYDYESAEQHFDLVVEWAPNFAEGYNQRAFIRFLRDNLAGAKTDLERALELEPRHFGALTGMFHVLLRQDRQRAAFGMLQRAVEIHPWIQERFGLPEDMWPESYRLIHKPDQEI